ncbi:hypothetical protein ACTWQN_18260 [Saccharopolyspora sp. 5N708]
MDKRLAWRRWSHASRDSPNRCEEITAVIPRAATSAITSLMVSSQASGRGPQRTT